MTCTLRTVQEMAEAGWSQEEIEALEMEVELARQKAKAEAYLAGLTLAQQDAMMGMAEMQTRRRVHDEWHAKLDTTMEQIRQMGAAKKLPTHG